MGEGSGGWGCKQKLRLKVSWGNIFLDNHLFESNIFLVKHFLVQIILVQTLFEVHFFWTQLGKMFGLEEILGGKIYPKSNSFKGQKTF